MRCPTSCAIRCACCGALLAMLAAQDAAAALFYSRQPFERGSWPTATLDFEGLAGPPQNYAAYPSGLVLAGAKLTGLVPGLPPTNSLFVIDPQYAADYDRQTGDVVSPGEADGVITIDLPAGTTAVGFDVYSFGGAGNASSQIVASSGGNDPLLGFASVSGPLTGWGFAGFTSNTPIARITITPSALGAVVIDNLRFGALSSALVAGDADGNGLIDASDYTLWADHFREIGRSFDQGDFDANGIVDGADYTLWADNFSTAGFFQSTVAPEPASWLLLLIGCGMISARLIARKREA